MAERKGEGMSPVLWIVVAIILALGVGFFGFKGLNFVGLTQGTITGVAGEYTYTVTGNFVGVCEDFTKSSEKYVPTYVLGGAFRPSITSAAETQGSKFNCCGKPLRQDAEELKSKGKYFTSDESESWNQIQSCLGACNTILRARTYCNNQDETEFDECMTAQLSEYRDCEP